MASAFADIERLLRQYFDALYYCDTEKLMTVFHPLAIYATADEKTFLYRTMDEYRPVIERRVSPASRGEARRDIIHSIEQAGKNTALARVGCMIGSRHFVDFLSLVRIGGEWKIISKVFQIIENANG